MVSSVLTRVLMVGRAPKKVAFLKGGIELRIGDSHRCGRQMRISQGRFPDERCLKRVSDGHLGGRLSSSRVCAFQMGVSDGVNDGRLDSQLMRRSARK